MKRQNKTHTILIVCIVSFLLILPDFVFSMFHKSFKHSCDPKAIFLIIPLSVGLIVNKYKWLSISFILLFCLLQLAQFFHIGYFGTQITHYAIWAGLHDFGDVLSESANVILKYFYVIPIVLIPFAAILFCLKIKCYKSIIGTLILCLTFSYVGYNRINLRRFLPNGVRFTIDNSMKSFFGYCYLICHKPKIIRYLPYEVNSVDDNFAEPITIVYVIGESVNYKHMSLFGYSKDTTPKLKELAKEDNFYYTTGISGGVNTLSSCKFIVNAIYEPNNVLQVSGDLTNLFRLAKQKGFKTFYISSQSDHVLMSLGGVSYIDTITTNGVRGVLDATKRMDNELPDIVSDDKLGKRNFIVLHQRHMHSPYTLKEFPSLKEYKKYMSERVSCFKEPNQAGQKEQLIAEYDEGMLYNDCFITKIFNRFNKQKEGKFYIIWTSDHGELLGEDGTYGHSALNPYIADIPVMIQSNDLEFMKDMKNIWKPTHYEIAKKVANKLGYEIKNPNEEENIFYISGVDFTGRCGYIKLKKEIENSKITYEKYLT